MRIFLLFILLLSLLGKPICYADGPSSARTELLKLLPTDHSLGSKEAPIVFIEYSSFTCPHCILFHTKYFPVLKEKWIDTGKLLFIHRDFPSDKASLYGAVLAHCAPREKYYTFLSILFENVQGWAVKNAYEAVENIGKLGNVSGQDFAKCVEGDVLDAILETKKQAFTVLDTKATPSFFINNMKYEGLIKEESFFALLQEAWEDNKK